MGGIQLPLQLIEEEFIMDEKNSAIQIFEKLAIIRKQVAEEEATKFVMSHMLELEGLDEDDIPQNSDIGFSLRTLLPNSPKLFATVQSLDLDVLPCGDYVCFKVDDLEGTEDLYFVSPTDILYLESGCLS